MNVTICVKIQLTACGNLSGRQLTRVQLGLGWLDDGMGVWSVVVVVVYTHCACCGYHEILNTQTSHGPIRAGMYRQNVKQRRYEHGRNDRDATNMTSRKLHDGIRGAEYPIAFSRYCR